LYQKKNELRVSTNKQPVSARQKDQYGPTNSSDMSNRTINGWRDFEYFPGVIFIL